MKSVQSVALCLMMMMMVSAGPLPPSLSSSRRDGTVSAHLHDDKNSTRDTTIPIMDTNSTTVTDKDWFESHQNVTLDDLTQANTPNMSTFQRSEENLQQLNRTNQNSVSDDGDFLHSRSSGRMSVAAPASCQLSICVLMNLGYDLQSGGDERAGRTSSDPFGHGK